MISLADAEKYNISVTPETKSGETVFLVENEIKSVLSHNFTMHVRTGTENASAH